MRMVVSTFKESFTVIIALLLTAITNQGSLKTIPNEYSFNNFEGVEMVCSVSNIFKLCVGFKIHERLSRNFLCSLYSTGFYYELFGRKC